MKGGEKHALTSRELADVLGVSESSVKRWVDSGDIEAIRTEGGHRRIPMAAAVRFMRTHRAVPAKPKLLPLASPPSLGEVDAGAAEQLYRALLRDDAGGARSIVQGRYLAGADISSIADGLIRPVLERVGELWRSQDEGILVEHRAVDTCVQVLSELRAWMPAPGPGAPGSLTAAGPRDPYLLPPLLASLCLAEQGWRTRNLGPLTPLETLIVAVRRYRPALCCLSVSVEESDGGKPWRKFAEAISGEGVSLVVGGRCVETVRGVVGNKARVFRSIDELARFAAELRETRR